MQNDNIYLLKNISNNIWTSEEILSFDFLLQNIKKNLAIFDIDLGQEQIEKLKKAYEIGCEKHKFQKRSNGEPYFNHPLWAAIFASEQKMDMETIIATMLHDTLEDTDYTKEQMIIDFGENIYNLVDGVTKFSSLKYKGAERHAESFRKFIINATNDVRTIVIKLCDRLHNVRTLEFIKEEKRKRIAIETIEIYARLANRLGMYKLKSELEDASFSYAYPKEYKKTLDILENIQSANENTLKKISETLTEELKVMDTDIDHVDYRVKRIYSLWRKLLKYNYDISKIYDISALKIIVPTIPDCYMALGVIHGLYKPVPGRFKDYIANPKLNGYKSLHTTIFTGDGYTIEIQIKTKIMDEEAEYGISSHASYKEKESRRTSQKVKEKNAWQNSLLRWQEEKEDSKEFLYTVKEEYLSNRVFIFTPKGEVIDLPSGSTPIDFAYAIHTDIGNHAFRAYHNDKLIPFDYKLKSNEVIRIETKDTATPSRKWLSSVKTTEAKKQISKWIKEKGNFFEKIFVK